jgi:hypothetical protein
MCIISPQAGQWWNFFTSSEGLFNLRVSSRPVFNFILSQPTPVLFKHVPLSVKGHFYSLKFSWRVIYVCGHCYIILHRLVSCGKVAVSLFFYFFSSKEASLCCFIQRQVKLDSKCFILVFSAWAWLGGTFCKMYNYCRQLLWFYE